MGVDPRDRRRQAASCRCTARLRRRIRTSSVMHATRLEPALVTAAGRLYISADEPLRFIAAATARRIHDTDPIQPCDDLQTAEQQIGRAGNDG